MKNMMEYRGYFGSVHYNDDDNIFYGKVEHIRSLISYEGLDVESLRTSFQEAVDDYLELNYKESDSCRFTHDKISSAADDSRLG
jgi:predicted HicB family RNase H-like nuclease